MISPLQMAASACLGAFIGYVTNALAIRSLFRPLQPRWFTLGWQGVIPRNRNRLAANISRVVGEDLLGHEYLSEQIQRPALQESLEAFIRCRLDRLLSSTPGDLFARLPPEWQHDGLERALQRVLVLLAEWAESENGLQARERLLAGLEQRLRQVELEQLLAPDQADELLARLSTVLARPQTRQELEGMLREQLDIFLDRGTTLEELVPGELRQVLYEQLRQLMPMVLRRVALWLAEPENVDHMSRRILAALQGYAESERGWSGVVGELGLRLFGEQLRAAIMERIPGVAYEYLHSAETRDHVEAQLLESVSVFLRRPVVELLGEHRRLLSDRLSWVVGAWVTSAEMQERLARFVQHEYQQHRRSTLGGLLPAIFWPQLRQRLNEVVQVDPARAAAWSVPLSRWVRARALSSQKPVREWAGISAADQEALTRNICSTATQVLRAEVPVLIEQLDLEGIVYEKIMGFDLLRVEQLVKSIIADQLRYINLFGALLGGLVGLLLPFLNAYLRSVSL